MHIAKILMKLSDFSLSTNKKKAYIQAASVQEFKKLNIPRMCQSHPEAQQEQEIRNKQIKTHNGTVAITEKRKSATE